METITSNAIKSHLIYYWVNSRKIILINKKIDVAVVGAGFISQVAHIKNLAEIEHVNLVGLAELRPKLGDLVANKFNIPRVFSSHKDLIENGKADLVYVITRRHHTGPIAMDFLEANYNVFTEKPMAQTYEKSKLLVEKANLNNCLYSVGFMRRYDRGVIKAKEIFQTLQNDKSLGKVLSARIYLSAGGDYCNISGDIKSDEPKPMHVDWPIAPEFLEDGLHREYEHFVNVNGHDINLMRYFFGMPLEVSHCYYKKSTGAVCIFDYDDFPVTYTWADTLQLTTWEEGLEINFEKGSLKLEMPPGFLINVPSTVKLTSWRSKDDIDTKHIQSDWSWAFKNEDFLVTKSTLEGNPSLSNGKDSLEDMKLIEAIWKKISKN